MASKSKVPRAIWSRSRSAVRIASSPKTGPASTRPSGSTMQLPPAVRAASRRSPRGGRREAAAEAPDEPLHRGRHELPMPAQERPVRSDEDDRAVERPAVPLHDADDEVDVVLVGDGAERLGGRAGHLPGGVPVTAEPVASLRRALAHAGPEVDALGIAAQERFGEDDEL